MTVRPFVRHALTAVALLAVVAAPAAAQKGKKGSGDSQPMAAPVRTSSAKSKPMAAPGGRTSSAKSKPMAAPTGRREAKAKPASEGKGKHKVTHTQAVDVSRRVLVEHGYVVSRVERRGDTQVIYYYRGNNGRGKGKGPLQRMVVRPTADRFVFDGAPADVRRAVTMRLQF